jgi:outer membrane cobalamin receptor
MIGTQLLRMSVTTVIVACAAPAVSSHSEDSRAQLITQEEIEASRAPTAYEVIQKLRANFLTYRGETSFDKNKSQAYPTVYVDGQEYGSVTMLRNIPASQVATIRLYRAWEATTKFGTGNMGGVIAVTTRQ